MKSQIVKIIFYYGDNNGITVNNTANIKVIRSNKTARIYKHKPQRFNKFFELTQLWKGDYVGIWSNTTTLTRPQ